MNGYRRYTVAFLAPEQLNGQPLLFADRLLGSVAVEMTDSQVTDRGFLEQTLADLLKDRGPAGAAHARVFNGNVTDGQIRQMLASKNGGSNGH